VKMKTTAKIITVFFVVLALSAGNLWAEIIEINITAEITGLDDPDGSGFCGHVAEESWS